jgi:molybdenum cofactor cytidylyltransferase
MTGAIVLAAGRSRRMGCQKLLLPFGGQTVIAHIVDEVLRSAVGEVCVVVGQERERLVEALVGRKVTIVRNPDAAGDMLSSVRCGLRALPQHCQAILVALGDQPAITSALIDEIIRAFTDGQRGLVVPVHEGRKGHPILCSAGYREEILTCHEGVGLRGLLQAHPDDILELPVSEPSVLADIDYPEDYRRELASFARHFPRRRDPGGK